MDKNKESNSQHLSIFKIWYLAIRPKTLPAAAGPVIVGLSLALGDGFFQFGPAFSALLAALLLQIGSNLANDVYDFKKGTDTKERVGPMRVTQAGLLSPKQVMRGMIFVFALSALVGLYLIFVGGWPILIVGICAIICAVAYTAGPYPLGYKGVADIFVFAFFGPAAVCGTYYLQSGNVNTLAWWASIPPGLLVTAILVVNNLRDIDTDRKAGKKTLAVRFGQGFAQGQYLMLVLVSYLIPLIMYVQGISSFSILLPWISLPLLIPRIKEIFTKKGVPLNATLAGTAKLGLIFCILFAIGFLMG
ncbi:MAG: 1,4-dihydroxy-2-naphthoate polyprenyltransferase [Peptococcaceae bacterium]|nr:1,4-dihydroxy-2-naphthoate polyprenyltransferase [Peptococcaceae bacterium]